MSDNTTGNMVTLMSKEGEGFLVSELVAKQSQMICHIIEDISDINFIPLPNVYTATLAMVIEYCKKHVEAAAAASRISDEDLRNWDKQFLEVDVATLLNLLKAADYLNIKGLLDLTCQKVADMIKGKNPEVIRQTFNIKNDFTPKEEEEIQREFQWAFE